MKTSIATALFLFAAFSGTCQSPEFVGKYDYPEVGVSLTVPSGSFGRDQITFSNQQAGFASNGFEAFLGYQIKFKKVPLGWYLSLSYAQMKNERFESPNGTTTKNGHYIFIGFINGLTFQTNTGRFDIYARALIAPAYIAGSRAKITLNDGTRIENFLPAVVGLGRGGEMGFVFSNRIRLGLSFIT
ncbi:MAG: hypothetical protein LC664_01275, partial [Flavobacteriales bacterium]|nr:hypothetical protein [Flavobacteriales bacterium]